MMTRLYSVFLILLSALYVSHSHAQVVGVNTTAPYDSPDYLINSVLLGEGVTATNITFTGQKAQIGYFTSGASSVGIDKGVVLSTGKVSDLPKLNGLPYGTIFTDRVQDDLVKVAALVPLMLNKGFKVDSTFDRAIIEFDFVPSSDSVSFRYVFGSEEYPKYIDTKYNDVFAFFISGPGINGPYGSPAAFPGGSINIAEVPNSGGLPITVSSVNSQTNSQYYINNPTDANISFNGYTRILTAYARVIPCQTYHIRLEIADGTAPDYDSSVMIEAGSFSSGTIKLEENVAFSSGGEVLEGCFTSNIVVRRNSKKSYNDTIYLSVKTGSQATDADISPLPPYIVIPAGADSVVLYFSVLDDGIIEGPENLEIDFNLRSSCVNFHRYYSVRIKDPEQLEYRSPAAENIKMGCTDPFATLDARLTRGYGYYTYSWEANGVPIPDSDSIIRVYPTDVTTYTATGGDTCGLLTIVKTFTVTPAAASTLALQFQDTIVTYCGGKEISVFPQGLNGANGIKSYNWTRYGTTFSTSREAKILVDSSGMYALTVMDSCGSTAQDSFYLKVLRTFPLSVTASNDTTICGEQPLYLQAMSSGGAGKITYFWPALKDTSSLVTVFPTSTTQFVVEATDECKTVKKHTVYVKVNQVHAEFEYSYFGDFGVQIQNFSTGKELQYTWKLDREEYTTVKEPVLELDDLEDHHLELTITDANGCVDYTDQTLKPPLFVYIPNTFTPNGDGINDIYTVQVIDPIEFEMIIFNRWGQEVFRSTNPAVGWDGRTVETNSMVFGSYIVFVKASRKNNIRTEQRGVVTLMP
ncbi:MAG: choice-of-anchor L domain-containing protein [Bacteroidota bacterium]